MNNIIKINLQVDGGTEAGACGKEMLDPGIQVELQPGIQYGRPVPAIGTLCVINAISRQCKLDTIPIIGNSLIEEKY